MLIGACDPFLRPFLRPVSAFRPWFGPGYNDTVGAGGQEFFQDGTGKTWIVFHGWKRGQAVRATPTAHIPTFARAY